MLDCFANCPRQAYHRYILKEKGPETEAMRKGNEFDKAVENRINHGTALPAEWAQHEQYAASVANMAEQECNIYTQLKLGITRDFRPTQFFAKDVWGRGVLDVGIIKRKSLSRPGEANTAIITDWKTGKNSEGKSYSNGGLQLKIFAAMLFKHFPGVDKITAFNLWLKTNEIGKPYVFNRSDEAQLWREILPRVMKMEQAFASMAWPETPGPLCGYCPVKVCQHNRS
jgi:PD-(D/E)XK nuclease superfamily protein